MVAAYNGSLTVAYVDTEDDDTDSGFHASIVLANVSDDNDVMLYFSANDVNSALSCLLSRSSDPQENSSPLCSCSS